MLGNSNQLSRIFNPQVGGSLKSENLSDIVILPLYRTPVSSKLGVLF